MAGVGAGVGAGAGAGVGAGAGADELVGALPLRKNKNSVNHLTAQCI